MPRCGSSHAPCSCPKQCWHSHTSYHMLGSCSQPGHLAQRHSGITAAQSHQEHPDIQNQNTPSLHVPIRIPRGQNSLHPKPVSSRCKWQHKRGRPWHRQQLMFHVECTIYVQDCPSMSKCHGLCPGTDGEEKATVSHGHGESIRIKSNQFTNLDRQHADLISHIIICNQPIYQ